MTEFQAARDALLQTIRRVFPGAKPAPRWAGVEAWAAPRPEAVVDHDAPGTYDPKVTLIGIADRKSGPVVYFLDPGDFFVLETQRALLEDAGLKLGRGCIYHTRKGALPTGALERLFRHVKERDENAVQARGTPGAQARRATSKKIAKTSTPKAAPKRRADTVEEYLAALPETHRAALEKLRQQIRAAAPGASEKMAYGIPTFVHGGRNLVHLGAFRDHCSFFPGRDGVTLALRENLRGYVTAKGTIQFRPEKPLPAALVKKIVKMRVAENDARAAKKAAAKKPKKTDVSKGGARRRAKRPSSPKRAPTAGKTKRARN